MRHKTEEIIEKARYLYCSESGGNDTWDQLPEDIQDKYIGKVIRKETTIPTQLDVIDVEPLRKVCEKYIDYLKTNNCCDDTDLDRYIFETALEAVYGNDIWNWVNCKKK
jgi:hypothetical protein